MLLCFLCCVIVQECCTRSNNLKKPRHPTAISPKIEFRIPSRRGCALTFCNKMNNRIAIAVLAIFGYILVSCDNSKRGSESSANDDKVDLAVVGNDYCNVHQNACKKEYIEIIVMHGPSYPESYWQVRRSEEYIQAAKMTFPNANSVQPYAVPGTSYAKEDGGKRIPRYYCPECREAEKIWHADKNKNAAE